jgi:hypothetical protein
MRPLGLPWECLDGALKGLNGSPRRISMGSLEGPHKREKVKQYLTRDLRGHEVCPYLVALMGPLKGCNGGPNRDLKGLYWYSS